MNSTSTTPLLLLAASCLASMQPLRADLAPPVSRFGQSSGNAKLIESHAEADFLQSIKAGVQITELGCMRATFVFDQNAEAFEARVTEAFSSADFRVFTLGDVIAGHVDPKRLNKIGNDRYADLVVYTKVSGRERPKLGRLSSFEAEATVQVYHPMSEELLVSHTVRTIGERHAEAAVAMHTAYEAAIDAAVKEVILKTLEKAHKIIVHEAQFKGVQDDQHLLEIMEYSAKLKGVYHVRQLSYEKTTGLAVIEIIGSPQTESFWRAYLNNMPKREKWIIDKNNVRIVSNAGSNRKNDR